MAVAWVTVTITVGEPQQEWCDRCLTSAAIRVRLFILPADQPVGELHGCQTCDPGLRSSTGHLVSTWATGVQADEVARTAVDIWRQGHA